MPDEFAAKLSSFIKKTTSLNSNNSLSVYMNGDTSRFDFSLIVIWLIAILTIILGALWTKHEFYLTLTKQSDSLDTNKIESNENLVNNNSSANQTLNESNRNESTKETKKLSSAKKNDENDQKQLSTITISYLSIFVLLLFVVGILLMLYFFYNVMSK